MPFQTPFEEKTAFFLSTNHKALIKTPFIVSKGQVLSFILLTNQQPLQAKRFLTVNRLTNEQDVKTVSLLDDVLLCLTKDI